MRNLRLDIVEVYDVRGAALLEVVFDRAEDQARSSGWNLGGFAGSQALALPDGGKISGVILTPNGPAVFALRPIVKSNGEGPPVGTFLFGRFLSEELVANLKDRIKVDFTLTPVDGVSEEAHAAFRQLLDAAEPQVVEEKNPDELIAYSLIRGFHGQPALLVSATVKRDILQIGQQVLIASVGGVATTAILVMAVLAVLLQWVLVGPLVRLTQHVVEVGADGALNRRVSLQRRDEIGILGREFDRMLGRLAEARNRLLDHSYQAGIAHMASGVLHNVRNQLMPAVTRAERLHEQLSERSSEQLDTAIAEFTSDRTAAERKNKIAAYIALSMQDMRDRQKGIATGLGAISQDLLRIEDVLKDLDRFSRVSTKIEAVSLASCIRETIKAVPSVPDVTVAIRVDPDVERQPTVASESFILKHVLQNLFVNAIEAIVSAGKATGTIKVTASARRIDGEDFVDLAIGDDGIGILPEHLPEIFKRGFSTKKDQRRGAGLHWCANSISAMSGRIFAESEGLNRGATLHVLLKVASTAKGAA